MRDLEGFSLSAALWAAIEHAMSKEGFDSAECRRYMALAYQKDDGPSYGRLLAWQGSHGEVSEASAASLAAEAFFGLRPSVLGHIAAAYPASVASRRPDGVDVCKAGLSMAISKNDAPAALALSKAMLGLPQGDTRLRLALAEAVALGSSGVGPSWRQPSDEERAERSERVWALAAECERAYLGSAVPEGSARKPSVSL